MIEQLTLGECSVGDQVSWTNSANVTFEIISIEAKGSNRIVVFEGRKGSNRLRKGSSRLYAPESHSADSTIYRSVKAVQPTDEEVDIARIKLMELTLNATSI